MATNNTSIENPWILAATVITANVGASFIMDDLKDHHKEYLNNIVFRKMIIFSLVYASVRNTGIALLMTLIYSLLIHWL